MQHSPLLFSFAAAAHPALPQQSSAHRPLPPSLSPSDQLCRQVTRIVLIVLLLCSCNRSHFPLLAQHAARLACLRLPTLSLPRPVAAAARPLPSIAAAAQLLSEQFSIHPISSPFPPSPCSVAAAARPQLHPPLPATPFLPFLPPLLALPRSPFHRGGTNKTRLLLQTVDGRNREPGEIIGIACSLATGAACCVIVKRPTKYGELTPRCATL